MPQPTDSNNGMSINTADGDSESRFMATRTKTVQYILGNMHPICRFLPVMVISSFINESIWVLSIAFTVDCQTPVV